MADLYSETVDAVRIELANVGAASPNMDTDTLAGLIAGAVIATAKTHAAATADPAAELANAPVPETDDPPALA